MMILFEDFSNTVDIFSSYAATAWRTQKKMFKCLLWLATYFHSCCHVPKVPITLTIDCICRQHFKKTRSKRDSPTKRYDLGKYSVTHMWFFPAQKKGDSGVFWAPFELDIRWILIHSSLTSKCIWRPPIRSSFDREERQMERKRKQPLDNWFSGSSKKEECISLGSRDPEEYVSEIDAWDSDNLSYLSLKIWGQHLRHHECIHGLFHLYDLPKPFFWSFVWQ